MYTDLFKTTWIALFAAITLVSGCNNGKDGPDPKKSDEKSRYVLSVRSYGANNQSTDYIVAVDSLSRGTISLKGKGIEQIGYRTSTQVGNRVFSVGFVTDQTCLAYELDANGTLFEKGKFTFEGQIYSAGVINKDSFLLMEVVHASQSKNIYVIDANDISIKRKIQTTIAPSTGDSYNKWPAGLFVRDGKLFIPYFHYDSKAGYVNTDTALVAVYSYPSMRFEKVIKDPRTSNIGMYADFNGLVQADNGDYYSVSTASIACGFVNKSTKPSGILRIKKGETDFDPNYFFNVEQATGGGKLSKLVYVGNGLAVARIVTSDATAWAGITIRQMLNKLYVLDLNNRTAKEVTGVPLHGGQYSTSALAENGKVYITVYTLDDGASVYEIDAATATGKKGAILESAEVSGFFKLTKGGS